MIEPEGLLATARLLLDGSGRGNPSQTCLRRAISAAYYALFHTLARQATDGMIGARHKNSPRYTTVYRGFEHRQMLEACAAVDKATLGLKATTALGVSSASQEIRDVANAFVRLQKRRHWADYSPTGNVTLKQAQDEVELAEVAIRRFGAADEEQRRNFLAYLLLPVRAG